MSRARLWWLVFAVHLTPTAAGAEELPPIVVAPFRNRCFDAAGLAQRVRVQLPEAAVLIGAEPAGAHQLVRVSGDDRQLIVQISLRNQRHRVVGSDERLLPLGDDCPAAAETAALIVVRAATPLIFRSPPPPRRPARPPVSHPLSENRTETPPAPSENRTASENPPQSASENRTAPETPPSENRTTPANPPKVASENRTEKPSEARTRPPLAPSENRTQAPSEIRTAPAPKRHRRLELDVAALWTFPLDGPPSTAAGDLTVGWRWRVGRRLLLGVAARAGVSDGWTATSQSSEGPISVMARRIPLGVELRLDFEVPLGVFRLAAGPEAVLWTADSTGLPRPGSVVFAQPGAFLRAAYRFELGPVVLQAGLELNAVFLRDNLTVGGVGTVAQTPVLLLSPFVGAGVGFF